MELRIRNRQKGSVVLVALCFVAVLGIALGSYLAVSNQSMKLSQRSALSNVSRQFAEMGLEEALRALSAKTFPIPNWSSGTAPNQTTVAWTTTGSTAEAIITLPPNKFGVSAANPAVNVRIHYALAEPWNVGTEYNTTRNMAWYRGVWFQNITANNQGFLPPTNPNYWISAPAAWNPTSNYNANPMARDIVLFEGSAYRCKVSHINRPPTESSFYWETGQPVAAWSASSSYNADQVVLFGGIPYRCIVPNSGQPPPNNTTFWVSAPVIYAEGRATTPDNTSTALTTQLVATIAPASLFPNAIAASDTLSLNAGGTIDSYNAPLTKDWNPSPTTYYAGDTVRSSDGTLYRCTAATTQQQPSTSTDWTSLSLGDSAVLAAGNTSATAVTVTSTKVYGYVAAPSSSTLPYDPRKTLGTSPAATLKSTSLSSPSVDLARISRSPYIPSFEPNVPPTILLPSAGGAGTTLKEGATLGSPGTTPSVYKITETSRGGNTRQGLDLRDISHTLTINGPVILNVSGKLRVSKGKIIISDTPGSNASLTVIFDGQLTIDSDAIIDNQTKMPEKLAFFGTTNSTTSSVVRNTGTSFHGVIHLPNGKLTVSGPTASSSPNFYGAFSAKNLTFSNSPNFHYDTSLRTATFSGIDTPFTITDWRELTDPTEKVTFP